MKSFTTLTNLFNTLTNNTSANNTSLGGQLISDQHRYTIQKYFDNERTVTTTTVGSQNLTLTASLTAGATSGTLTAAWTYPTGYQYVNFSDGEQRSVLFTNGSTAISWADGLTGSATTAIKSLGFQDYAIPANVSKIKNDTINVGQLKYQPIPIESRAEWDAVNFLPYNSDIPAYYFIYNGNLSIFPIPSTTGNILTFNYQTRVADMSFSDYSTGTLAQGGMVAGSTTVTGANATFTGDTAITTAIVTLNAGTTASLNITNGTPVTYTGSTINGLVNGTIYYAGAVTTSTFTLYTTSALTTIVTVTGNTLTAPYIVGGSTNWSSVGAYPTGVDITYYNLKIRANPPYGDGIWYPIRMFNSDTSLTLALPVVNAPNITPKTTYTIGQFPLLQEDFHDMLVYGAMKTYYSSLVKDATRFKEFDALYKERLELLEAYAGTKSVNVDLGDDIQPINPNLFYYAPN